VIDRVLQAVHGHAGVLAAIALLHPAILLRDGRPLSRGGTWSVGLTALITALAYGLGIGIYGSYRTHVKRELFRASFEAGLLFETKEHLAFAIICMTLGAAFATFVAPRGASELRRASARIFGAAAVLCFVTSALGIGLAAIRDFPGG